ncbi:sulfofructose kinase [Litoreibacter ponti]|uniref:Sulfofructose kinase n=1 Tax=Litoreibacter ponti TaxID=1510457 RepID=A0A2T6BFK3_9RHOB|nr:PfkB family carbohydrate kinase [Litoreibacter ponti]PTX54840.1 sulfofructose kinase [Litoreibacter ponti]
MARVFVAGSAVLDFVYRMESLPVGGEKFQADGLDLVGGGCAANAAVAVQRLGGHAQLLARFGQDEVCDLVCDDLRREGVDLTALELTPGRSAVSSVYVDAAGERQIMAFRGEGLCEVPKPCQFTADAVLADTRWEEATLAAFARGRELGVPCVLDGEAPVSEAMMRAASHIVFSEQGLDDTYRNLEEAHRALGVFVAVTRGANGVDWIDDAPGHLDAHLVVVKDTLGAGDVWHGAFALMLAEGRTTRDAMRFAQAAASLKCEGAGGRRATPTRDQVIEFLKERDQWN